MLRRLPICNGVVEVIHLSRYHGAFRYEIKHCPNEAAQAAPLYLFGLLLE